MTKLRDVKVSHGFSLSHYISQETSHLRSSSLNTQCRQVSNSLSILFLAYLEWGEGEITNRILPWNFSFEHGFGEGFEEGSGRVQAGCR